jgi:inner nuclear membrane protein Man1
MDNLELLSDDQLRLRLLQYGFANLPITETTRKTLIKKLRNHMNNTSTSLRKTTSLVTRYSSGEESDTIENNSNGVKTRKGRMTVSGSPAGRNVVDQNMPPPKSISYPVMSLSKPSTPTTTSPSYNRSAITSSGGKKGSVYVSPVIINDSEDDDIDYSVKKSRTLNTSLKNVSARNRSDLYTTLDSSQQNGNGYEQDEADDANTTSDYTKRLLQLREGNIQRQNNNNNNLRKRTSYTSQRLSDYQPDDIVYHAEPSLEPAHIPLNTAIRNFINRLDAAYGFKQTFVPMVLLSLLIVFFMLIVFAYVTISPNIENILNPASTLYVPCDSTHSMDASYACIDEHSLESSLNLLKLLAPELQSRAVAQRCGDKSKSISNVMCVKDFWHFLSENHPQNRYVSGNSQGLDMIKDVHNIEYLVDRNKQWGVSNVDENGKPTSLDDVVKQRAHQAECFAILKPKLPITCTIYNKIQTFFFIIGTLAIIGLGVVAVQKFYQFVLHVKEKRRAQIDQIIREICNTLMEKSIHDKENPSVILNHLRDKIIEPSKRSELAWAWNEAITYLEQNDSRIHFGLETINGEDFKVIRWIDDNKNLSSAQSSPQQQMSQLHQQRLSNSRYNQQPEGRIYATTKKWMGSAFDKSNKIKDPPTNCLKIRQMFDKYEANSPNLPTIIQDTILQKLRDKNCKLYDIQLDLKTCCVYVKCGTTADAGIVHEEINGWWLDAGLVVVKFLKQEKYHQRFPSAVNANTCLQPSSNFFVTQNDNGNNGGDEYFDDEIDDDDFE